MTTGVAGASILPIFPSRKRLQAVPIYLTSWAEARTINPDTHLGALRSGE